MPRQIDDVMGKSMPAPGRYLCKCVDSSIEQSKTKKTPFIELTWAREDDGSRFTDSLFVVAKAMSRLALVAKRLCGWPEDMTLPDDDGEAVTQLRDYIMDNIGGVEAYVTVERQTERYMPTQGPDAGRTVERHKNKVAYNGYEPATVAVDTAGNTQSENAEKDEAPLVDREDKSEEAQKDKDLDECPF